jgi:hypothetical protein
VKRGARACLRAVLAGVGFDGSLFVQSLKHEGLCGGELVALDGSKFKASITRDRNFSRAKLKDRQKELDEKPALAGWAWDRPLPQGDR